MINLPLVDVLNYELTRSVEVKISLPTYNPPSSKVITHPIIDRESAKDFSILRQKGLPSNLIVSDGLANAFIEARCLGCIMKGIKTV